MSAALAIIALLPWLVLAPVSGVPSVLAHALALGAALHGAGLVVARLAGRPGVHPLLAIQWGLAAQLGLMGVALALGIGGFATQIVLVYGGAAVHTVVIGTRFAAHRERLVAAWPHLRFHRVPAALLAMIAALHVLGAAGDLGAYPFDDDGSVLAQLQRLRDTGALADPIGYARAAQLGGQLAFGALATAGGDVHLVRIAEGIAFALALALALARLRPDGKPDPTSGLWGVLIVVAGAALTYARPDPAACWTAVGLALALHATLDDHAAAPLPTGLVAGALATLRLELAPLAAVALAVAWWRHRRAPRRAAALLGGALAVVVPYAVARSLAWGEFPAAARALVALPADPLGGRLLIFAGVAAACVPLVVLAWRAPGLRWLGAGAALVIAGVASRLTGPAPYASGFLWPLAIAGGLALVIHVARSAHIGSAALLASLVLVVFIYDGRAASGRKRWTRRYLDLVADLDYLRTARDHAPVSSGYEPALRAIPPGAVVAVWVARPERLPYDAGFRIVDLRTPRAAWLRTQLPWSTAASVGARLAAVGAELLLLEEAAPIAPDGRRDGLAEVAAAHATLAAHGGVRLVDLRRPGP